MKRPAVEKFNYYVGIHSLAQIATAEDRVCILNILGNESRSVTPISHAYSGGNIVFGTSPGRKGEVLKTPSGDIPVFSSVREGLNAGLTFNVGVVYLPPTAVRDGVYELIRVNPNLEKIVILTEKVPTHDSREIRAYAQQNNIDVFGANSLGVADAWNHLRLGGALGGENPEETLSKGSIAIYSNSGNFTTTIASYLRTSGWGTTTSLSSGKDVYIHFAPAEFANALANDERSKAAVMYIEPGGYYEEQLDLQKPIVACVVGRWKARLTRAVGHAGAIAGGGDTAEDKERWFMRQLNVDGVFTSETPRVSKMGAVVTDISLIPMALTEVMKLNGLEPDFAPEGDLALKPWFGNNSGLALPPEIDLPTVEALSPYREQIDALARQVGATFPRQNMKDCSGSSVMDSETQVTRVNGISILESTKQPLESNMCLALVHELNDANDNALFNLALASQINLHDDITASIADAVRMGGNSPNTILAAACCAIGPARVKAALETADILIELFAPKGLLTGDAPNFDISAITVTDEQRERFLRPTPDPKAEAIISAYRGRGAKSVFVNYLLSLGGYLRADVLLAALTTTIAWEPLMRKRISRLTVRNLPWFTRLYATLLGASVESEYHSKNSFCGVPMSALLESWSATEIAYLALFGERPDPSQLLSFQTLLGLIISNGVGTISAQGAKGSVSADGPETPERVQINKAFAGFLTHTGFAHGGNGFEGIQFLIEIFSSSGLSDPKTPNNGLNLKTMAFLYADAFKTEKEARKAAGEKVKNIPGINHPVFKGQPINQDPREVFIADFFQKRGEYNVFHAFYKTLVQALYEAGATPNVFCVNIDAVISSLLLKILWPRFRNGQLKLEALRFAAFTAFLFGRMVGCAGEIDDHINRGRNMDTRTPTSQCRTIS